MISRTFVVALAVLLSACVSFTLFGGQSIAGTFRDNGVRALVQEAIAGNSTGVARVAGRGVDVNTVGNNGTTPLLWAVNERSYEGIEALLKAGADPNLVTPQVGHSAVYFVSMGDDPELLALLLRFGGDAKNDGAKRIEDRPLYQAAAKGRIANLKLLLAAGVDINTHDRFDESAATATLALAKFEALAFLLNNGYTFNLSYISRGVNLIQVPANSDAQAWKDRVRNILNERGIVEPQ